MTDELVKFFVLFFVVVEPINTTRSVSSTSRKEQVVAAAPMASRSATVDGAWQTRAALSMLAIPSARAALPAT